MQRLEGGDSMNRDNDVIQGLGNIGVFCGDQPEPELTSEQRRRTSP